MLGWVITCHDELAQEMLDRLEQKFGPLAQCRAVNYWRNLSSNMLSRMMCACAACHRLRGRGHFSH